MFWTYLKYAFNVMWSQNNKVAQDVAPGPELGPEVCDSVRTTSWRCPSSPAGRWQTPGSAWPCDRAAPWPRSDHSSPEGPVYNQALPPQWPQLQTHPPPGRKVPCFFILQQEDNEVAGLTPSVSVWCSSMWLCGKLKKLCPRLVTTGIETAPTP